MTPATQKACAILAMVLVAEGGRRSRSWLIDHLWSEKPRSLGQTSLRQSLKEIRKSLSPACAGMLTIDNFVVAIDLEKCVFEDRSNDDAAGQDFLEGIDIGDPEFEEWLTLERRHWEKSETPGKAPAAIVAADARPPPRFGLRIDPVMVSGFDREEEALANVIVDRIVTGLVEDGFHDILDRRSDSISLLAKRDVDAMYSLCLRCSVRRVRDSARVAIALVDLAEEQTIWRRVFDAATSAIHRERDADLAAGLSQCIDRIWLEKENTARLRKLGEDGADTLRAAVQDMFELGVADLARAEKDLRRLIPTRHGALASAWLAFLVTFRVGQRFVRHDSALHEEARDLVARALERDPANSVVLALAGHVHSYLFGNYVRAAELFEQAIRINPGRALAWDLYSVLHAYIGRPQPGLQCALFARHLGAQSLYRYYFDTSCLITASMLGRHDLAIRHGEAVLDVRPDFNSVLRYLTSSYGHSGLREKAAGMHHRLLAVEPSFSLEALRDARYPGLDTQAGRYFLRGLKKAGVREIAA
ncbi:MULTISPECIES: SARP family transcriptional regulator [unclassified Mesorhizobium]|uniref:SARP family transcriptional regulator n=1 Tax=unclassified Mesorhizobium TaxID=325217 RepID=UPI000FCC397E|nr:MULTISPECIES: SARP family transcriptional regulator [unclassified Mesorhizobium]RUY11257.1 SARP family transcriptional regulator [Mesorhizobium sp. M2A.F.Ca.ET.040.01.1.1]RWA91628.1 MAG: SARP family transcriptional regulator [Mesorhizobium sp.]TIV14886.1 MAG: SARP family transcriptional regulator [Mesorhizobium sp.]